MIHSFKDWRLKEIKIFIDEFLYAFLIQFSYHIIINTSQCYDIILVQQLHIQSSFVIDNIRCIYLTE